MTPVRYFLVVLAAAMVSCVLTWSVRRLALARRIVDVPNERSAHSDPTPTGGGLALAAVILIGALALAALGMADAAVVIALLGGGLLIAVTGWLDDLRSVSPAVRGLVQLCAAAWAMFWLDGLNAIQIGSVEVTLGGVGFPLGVIGIVWSINLYNFMDGIDGIAAVEALTVAGAGAVLLLALGEPGLALITLLVVGASAGFMVWNWPPAKIFMGDVGSGLLGFTFAVLAIASENRGALPITLWTVLLAVFVFDATVTLIRRALHGEILHRPHSRHAYQRAARFYGTHRRVTIAVLLLNLALAASVLLALAIPTLFSVVVLLVAAGVVALYVRLEQLNPMWPMSGSVSEWQSHEPSQ